MVEHSLSPDHKVYVLGFLVVGGAILLIRKRRPGWQEDKYNGVGGEVRDGETMEEAMARECLEETGYQTAPEDWEPRLCFTFGDRTVCVFGLVRPKLKVSELAHHPEARTGDESFEWHPWAWLHANRGKLVKHVLWFAELCRESRLGASITATIYS